MTRRARRHDSAGVRLLLAILPAPSLTFAKGSCPPGAYVIDRGAGAAAIGMAIELQEGTVELPGVCTAVAARGWGIPLPDRWFVRVIARWQGCDHGVTALRANLDPRCTELRGRLRVRRGHTARFHATRVPVCGDGIVQAPEECEPDTAACCTSACRTVPGCDGPCRSNADCAPIAICDWTGPCGIDHGTCRFHTPGDCIPTPVCGCDRQTYANVCDAWSAGVPVEFGGGACATFCRLDTAEYECAAKSFCEVAGRFCDEKTAGAYGRCVPDPDPATCIPETPTPICGCNGVRYADDCARRAAHVQWGLCPGQAP